jgi:hypothetical protein
MTRKELSTEAITRRDEEEGHSGNMRARPGDPVTNEPNHRDQTKPFQTTYRVSSDREVIRYLHEAVHTFTA